MERKYNKEEGIRRESVLNYFIDPKNIVMGNEGPGYENFAKSLLNFALGDLRSAEHEKILNQMTVLFNDTKDARRFNATYVGHMLSEATIPAMTAHMYATRLGSNSVAAEVSKLETKLEPEAIGFLLDIVGYDKDKASGTFTSGGSMAAFTALAAARKVIQEKYELESSLVGQKKAVPEPLFVFTTPMVHYCFHKALDYLGGQNRAIQAVMVDTKNLKMSAEDLERKIYQYQDKGMIMAVYAIAGETETGLVDPLGDVVSVVEKYNSQSGNRIFTIADAAYGAPYKLSSQGRLFDALPRYDAIVIDGHKALYTPYPNGAVLFRDANDHVTFGMGVDATYVQMSNDREEVLNAFLYKDKKTGKRLNLGKQGGIEPAINLMLNKKRPEGSGSAGSILSTVATKRTLGKEGLTDVFEITLDRIQHLYERLNESPWFMPFHDPDVNVLCFTLTESAEESLLFPMGKGKEKERNQKRKDVLEAIREQLNINNDGKTIEGTTGYYFSSTDLNLDALDDEETAKQHKQVRMKHYVLRSVLMNPRTTNKILDDAVDKMEKVVEEMISENASV